MDQSMSVVGVGVCQIRDMTSEILYPLASHRGETGGVDRPLEFKPHLDDHSGTRSTSEVLRIFIFVMIPLHPSDEPAASSSCPSMGGLKRILATEVKTPMGRGS